jgi:transposase
LQVSKLHACLEATGVYGEAIALFLHERGHLISVVNPLRIKGYAQSNMQRNKIDRLDAQLIADFCLTQKPESWPPPLADRGQTIAIIGATSRSVRRNASGGRKPSG